MIKLLKKFTGFAILALFASCACPPEYVEVELPPAVPGPSFTAAPILGTPMAVEEAEEPLFDSQTGESVQVTEVADQETAARTDFTFSSHYFSPDEERLIIFLPDLDITPIEWKVEILEPRAPYLNFYEWVGEGTPPSQLVWDGKSSSGEWVQSATDYPIVYTARDIYGNIRTAESRVTVDAFYIREGNDLRIMVPSIVFGPNSGTWDGLDEETIASNEWIISRIALALNDRSSYRVKVEGHANPTTNPRNPYGRSREENLELEPLSEARARTVVDALVRQGVDRNRLSYTGKGGSRPVAAWDDYNNWWKNRRVEFILSE